MAEVEVVSVSRTVVGRGPRAVGRGELVIQDFQTEMDVCKQGDNIESKPFKVKENIFSILVYPNGYDEETNGKVCVMVGNGSNKEVTVDMYQVTIDEDTEEVVNNAVFKAKGSHPLIDGTKTKLGESILF